MKGWRWRINAVTPLICLITYLAIGFTLNIWHPTWTIFFMILIVPVLLSEDTLYSLYPILCLAAYLVMGLVWGWWHPAWLIFLTIPVYYILFGPLFHRHKGDRRCSSRKEKIIEIIEKIKD